MMLVLPLRPFRKNPGGVEEGRQLVKERFEGDFPPRTRPRGLASPLDSPHLLGLLILLDN
jgi:hypothetical protein